MSKPGSGLGNERLAWLDVLRLLAIVQILGFHWLRTCFETGRYDLTSSPAYQDVGIGFGQLHFLIIDHTGHMPAALINNVIGLLFGVGWEAVNVFILISGLGLTLNYRPERRDFSLGTWYSHRFRRILVPFYSVAFPLLIAGALFKLAALGQGGVLGTLAAKLAAKNLAEPLPVEFLTHLFLLDPRQSGWGAHFFAPAWWFIPPLLLAYLAFPWIYRAIDRFGALPVLGVALAVSIAGYLTTDNGLLFEYGWYFIIYHELFNFTLGIVVGRLLRSEPGRAQFDRAITSTWWPLFGCALFVAGNIANWFPLPHPICSALFTPGFALMLAFVSVRLSRSQAVLALCRAIDPYYLYLLHQPFVLPMALIAASLAGVAGYFNFALGFVLYMLVAAAVVVGFMWARQQVICAATLAVHGVARRRAEQG